VKRDQKFPLYTDGEGFLLRETSNFLFIQMAKASSSDKGPGFLLTDIVEVSSLDRARFPLKRQK
jgi:hypothetical protein